MILHSYNRVLCVFLVKENCLLHFHHCGENFGCIVRFVVLQKIVFFPSLFQNCLFLTPPYLEMLRSSRGCSETFAVEHETDLSLRFHVL